MSDALALIVIGFHRSTCVFFAPEQHRTSGAVEYVSLRELHMAYLVRLWHINRNVIDRECILYRTTISRSFGVIHAGNVTYLDGRFDKFTSTNSLQSILCWILKYQQYRMLSFDLYWRYFFLAFILSYSS